jgi:hypothetical protein
MTLKSDATFGRGDGIVGLVDAEIEHDTYGLPFLRGRTLKGLLVEECANILFALEKQHSSRLIEYCQAARFLFGQPGSTVNDDAKMRVGAAQLPNEIRYAVQADIDAGRLTSSEVLASLTAIRRQTAVNEQGAPAEGSLRSLRVLLRETTLVAELQFEQNPDANAEALLVVCGLALRRAGIGRNRGRGRVEVSFVDPSFQKRSFTHFRNTV